MKIGIDFDGVICDCGRLKIEAAKQLYGVDIPSAQSEKELVIGNGWLTQEQYRELKRVIYETKEFYPSMRLVDGALFYLAKLIADGHAVSVITSRLGLGLEIAREWTTRQGLALEIVGVGYGNDKVEATRGIDVFIDDDLRKLRLLAKNVPRLFLFSWEYNKHQNENGIARRISLWREFYQAIQAIGALVS